jgi:hypothetical protein
MLAKVSKAFGFEMQVWEYGSMGVRKRSMVNESRMLWNSFDTASQMHCTGSIADSFILNRFYGT